MKPYTVFEITMDMITAFEKKKENLIAEDKKGYVPRYAPTVFAMRKTQEGKYVTLEEYLRSSKELIDIHVAAELGIIKANKKAIADLEAKVSRLQWNWTNSLAESEIHLRNELEYEYQRKNKEATIAAFCGGILFGAVSLLVTTTWLGLIN